MHIFDEIFRNCEDAIIVFNEQLHTVFSNTAADTLFKHSFGILLNPANYPMAQLLERQEESYLPLRHSPINRIFSGDSFCNREFILRFDRSQKAIRLAITGYPISIADPSFRGCILIIRSLDRPKAIALQRTADPMELASRKTFMGHLQQALEELRQGACQGFAVFCLDVKRLKAVNDTFGYLAGDRLLLAIADRLLHILSPRDILSRLGGDEFMLLTRDTDSAESVAEFAKAIHLALTPPFELEDSLVKMSVSVGVSLGNRDIPDADTLIRQADIAMHHCKEKFAESYCLYKPAMGMDLEDSVYLEIDLRNAIANRGLRLAYQPIFSVRSRRVLGVEALVRWHHPTRGVLSPSQFIPLAEKSGLIIPLGLWVLEEACRQLKFWQETIPNARNMFVSVNMSSQQFAQGDILAEIQQVLTKTRLDPRHLKIEITESVLINNSDSIIEILKSIKSLGIQLSVDDFGTGYSSLSYLHRFPVDILKIDRSFLENADSDYEKLEILQSVVRLAWNLGLEVVAEGIETEKHFAQVQALRCESGQGFLFSEPLDRDAIERILWQPLA